MIRDQKISEVGKAEFFQNRANEIKSCVYVKDIQKETSEVIPTEDTPERRNRI